MAKKETEPQIEAKAETQNGLGYFPKINKDIYGEIFHLIKEVDSEIQWLEQHCQEIFETGEADQKLTHLIEIKNMLETTRNLLRRESYSLLYGTDYAKYIYGEISEEEFDRITEL